MTSDNNKRTDRVLEPGEALELPVKEVDTLKDRRIAWLEERLAAEKQHTDFLTQWVLNIYETIGEFGKWSNPAFEKKVAELRKLVKAIRTDTIEREQSPGGGDGR
jgi:hypothetical protein